MISILSPVVNRSIRVSCKNVRIIRSAQQEKRAASHDLGTSCEADPCAFLVCFEEFRDKSLGCIPVILCGYSGDGKTGPGQLRRCRRFEYC